MSRRAKFKGSLFILLALIIGFCLGLATVNNTLIKISNFGEVSFHGNPIPDDTSVNNNIDVCFTPPSGCTAIIVKAISSAKESIYVQAYGMSSAPIVKALINAKARGVAVEILLDKSNLKQGYSKINELHESGIIVGIDRIAGIAHNKVIIIDHEKVITGSFNFTAAAETRNAENVIIVEDTNIAKQYLKNWHNRKKQSLHR
jgi:phospholipase D